MIDTYAIGEYNKTRAYARNKYRPYNDIERKALQEAAPLLKFTLEKRTREIESKNIDTILTIGRKHDFENIIITGDQVQFFNHSGAGTVTNIDAIKQTMSNCCHPHTSVYYKHSTYIVTAMLVGSLFNKITMDSSDATGAYVFRNHTYEHVPRSKDVLSMIWRNGYIAAGTRIPTVVPPNVFSMKDVEEMKIIIEMFDEKNLKSNWSNKFMKMFYRQTHKMRFPGYTELMQKARKMSI